MGDITPQKGSSYPVALGGPANAGISMNRQQRRREAKAQREAAGKGGANGVGKHQWDVQGRQGPVAGHAGKCRGEENLR